MNKRVLLTGASGFIGAQVLDSLIGKGYEVHVVVRSKDIFFSKEVKVHFFDLFDIESHAKLMKEVSPSHLVHCAWYTEHGKYWESLYPKNRWGGNFSNLVDCPHFERNV
jgi:nucleoside-diphosphate-sugar epimerase